MERKPKEPNCVCKTCSKPFRVPPSQIRAGRKYCSVSCVPSSGENNHNWKGGMADRTCEWCGVRFETKQNTVRRGHGKFCSKKCTLKATGQNISDSARNKRVIRNCEVCRKEISIKPSHAGFEGKYCSRSCMAVAYKYRFTGVDNPNHRHGRSGEKRLLRGMYMDKDIVRLWVRQRGGCAMCDASLDRDGMHRDHIIPIARGGSNFIGNIQLLCAQCNLRKGSLLPVEYRYRSGVRSKEFELSKLLSWVQVLDVEIPELRMMRRMSFSGNIQQQAFSKQSTIGLSAGVPDLNLPTARAGFHGLYLEMKVGRNKPSEAQIEWINDLENAGYACYVCYGWMAAARVIKDYLEGRPVAGRTQR